MKIKPYTEGFDVIDEGLVNFHSDIKTEYSGKFWPSAKAHTVGDVIETAFGKLRITELNGLNAKFEPTEA